MTDATLTRELAFVALALIDDPALPARESMDDAKFGELVASIRQHGIIQPLFLKPTGARYEVVAGHRRRLASIAAELDRVPAIIVRGDASDAEAIKLHENTKREALNAAEEASWFTQLLEKHASGDTDKLCVLVGESRQYVESRLMLLRHDPDVFAALKAGAINFAVATELNRISDIGARRAHLEAAVKGGATARLVREWRLAYERLVGTRQELDGSAGDHLGGVEQPAGSVLACLFCTSSADPHAMTLVYMHRHCLMILERTLNVQLTGIFGPPAAPASTPAPSGDPS